MIYRAVEDKKYNVIETMLEFGHGCDVSSVCQNGRQPSGLVAFLHVYAYMYLYLECVSVYLLHFQYIVIQYQVRYKHVFQMLARVGQRCIWPVE